MTSPPRVTSYSHVTATASKVRTGKTWLKLRKNALIHRIMTNRIKSRMTDQIGVSTIPAVTPFAISSVTDSLIMVKASKNSSWRTFLHQIDYSRRRGSIIIITILNRLIWRQIRNRIWVVTTSFCGASSLPPNHPSTTWRSRSNRRTRQKTRARQSSTKDTSNSWISPKPILTCATRACFQRRRRQWSIRPQQPTARA